MGQWGSISFYAAALVRDLSLDSKEKMEWLKWPIFYAGVTMLPSFCWLSFKVSEEFYYIVRDYGRIQSKQAF